MNDDGNLAVFIGTNLETGDTVTVCPNCLVAFCAAIVEGMTGLAVTSLMAQLEADVASEEPNEEPNWDELITEEWFLEHQAEIMDEAGGADDVARASIAVWQRLNTPTTDEPNVATSTN